jgi:hypothetical protein
VPALSRREFVSRLKRRSRPTGTTTSRDPALPASAFVAIALPHPEDATFVPDGWD